MLETIRKHAWKLLLSSVIILLPMLAGVLLWDRLPEQMATHWGFRGEPDGWSGRGFVVFGMPLIILVLNWICVLAEKQNFRRNPKPMWLVFWICPAVSLVGSGVTYAYALGLQVAVHLIAVPLCGLMFIFIGNYMPKCRRNYTLGVKLKWTLEREDNWNATHRFAGRVWVAAGAAMLASMLLPGRLSMYAAFALMAAAAAAPVVYSWRYACRHGQDDEAGHEDA